MMTSRARRETEKNCLRIHVLDDFDFSKPLSAARLARKAMSLETGDDRLKMITEDELSTWCNGDVISYARNAMYIHCHVVQLNDWLLLEILVCLYEIYIYIVSVNPLTLFTFFLLSEVTESFLCECLHSLEGDIVCQEEISLFGLASTDEYL